MDLLHLPDPSASPGTILVKTHFSAISTGTEGRTVSDARKGYIAKARARKEEVSKVIKTAQTIGLSDTVKLVRNKLESLQTLGYSLSGEVVAVGKGVQGFKTGDRVACAGATASHSEMVVIPENLAVKLLPKTPIDQAAFTAVGAIALQGVRKADLRLGENAVVIGLGLIGQITMRLLNSGGINAFGIDLKESLVKAASENGQAAALRSDDQLLEKLNIFSSGNGVDSVIITAGTSSTDPIELAGAIARKGAKVIIVGAVPTGFKRKNYYRKELSLIMSTSYGPGRYDSNYEEKGLDYPISHVRWTENRNMKAFANLLASGNLDLSNLISHRFPFEDAKSAYDLIVDPAKDKMGVLFEYDLNQIEKTDSIVPRSSKINTVSFIGAGSFATNFLLPFFQDQIGLEGVFTRRAHSAENAKKKFGFKETYANSEEFFKNDQSGAVVIASRHDTHAPYALESIRQGKRVFLEKPLCLNMDQYMEMKLELSKPESGDLMLGFNRRFAPLIAKVKGKLSKDVSVAINYRVNAGILPSDHWVNDADIGGGRIIGEVCHFVDLCTFLSSSLVESVSATALENQGIIDENTAVINLYFTNGSVANISYLSNGNKAVSKEYLEVFSGGLTAQLDDFKELKIFGNKAKKEKLPKQDKGHKSEVHSFIKSIRNAEPFKIEVEESLNATLATFAIIESIRNAGKRINLIQFESEWISPKAN